MGHLPFARQRYALWLAVAVGLLVGGCAEAPPAPEVESRAGALSLQRLPTDEGMPRSALPSRRLPDGTRFARAAQAGACAQGCADDRPCLWRCIIDDAFEGVRGRDRDEAQCLFCGRETGFLEAPHLNLELDDKTAVLTWSAVEGAADYVVHGIRWQTDEATVPQRSHTWRTAETRLQVELDEGAWSFYVIAYGDAPKQRSGRSNLVAIDL